MGDPPPSALRQPSKEEEEEEEEEEEGNTSVMALPDELLFDILARVPLPAEDICDRARLVCRKWYIIIHSDAAAFVYAMDFFSAKGIKMIQFLRLQIETSMLKCKCRPSNCSICDSCNGLFLGFCSLNALYIMRPVGWVKYPEVLAFRFTGMGSSCIFSNLHTHEIDSINLPRPCCHYSAVVHRKSLVWLG